MTLLLPKKRTFFLTSVQILLASRYIKLYDSLFQACHKAHFSSYLSLENKTIWSLISLFLDIFDHPVDRLLVDIIDNACETDEAFILGLVYDINHGNICNAISKSFHDSRSIEQNMCEKNN